MSWIDTLSNLTRNVGRGGLDLFTLGGNELGHKFGGQGYQNFLKPIETGFGANFEAGATGGGLMQGLGAMGGGGTMTPYMPTSIPNMGMAGSTLGGGMGSPLNLGPSAMGSTGAAPGVPMAMSAGPSHISQILQMMRGMPGGGGQQAPASHQTDILQRLYQMFPSLKPGSSMGQGMRMGGM